MTCEEFRDRVTVQLADGSEAPGTHGASCADCGRYAELARAAWEAAGRDPDEPVPGPLADDVLRLSRRPRRTDLTLLRPGSVAGAVGGAEGRAGVFAADDEVGRRKKKKPRGRQPAGLFCFSGV